MGKHLKTLLVICTLALAAFSLFGCSASPQPSATPVIVTVVSTVPVEVTRIVEVPQTVEVTRQVVVTQIVEVPVTPAPTATVAATSTPTAAAFVAAFPTATFPEGKVQGYSYLKIINETEDLLTVTIDGPIFGAYSVSGNASIIKEVKEGTYTYVVEHEARIIYRGTMKITNPDKHELVLHDDKAVFRVP